MKKVVRTRQSLLSAGRWDIDFHLEAEGIKAFPPAMLRRIDEVAFIAQDKRDPTTDPEAIFEYIDIINIICFLR